MVPVQAFPPIGCVVIIGAVRTSTAAGALVTMPQVFET